MKTLKRIRLNDLSNAEMANSEMNQLRGGADPEYCGCGCNYKDKGGANTIENRDANSRAGYTYSVGGNKECWQWIDPDGDGKYDQGVEVEAF